MIWRRLALIAALTAWPLAAPAQTLDPASQAALDQTLRILLDPQARSGELAKSPQGAAADQQIRALTGSDARTQELYEVAGEVLKDLAQSTGGDPQKMLLALDRARTDPAAFAAMLSPATQERLRALAVKLR